jgi:hypothetical protein
MEIMGYISDKRDMAGCARKGGIPTIPEFMACFLEGNG